MIENGDFRERLLAAQTLTPAYREEYERKVNKMANKELKPIARWVRGFHALLLFGAAGFEFWIQRTIPSPWIKVGVLVMGIMLVFLGVTQARAAYVGRADFRWTKAAGVVLWLSAIFFASLLVFFAAFQPINSSSILLVEVGLFVLIIAGISSVEIATKQSELIVREKLLELELKLDEIAERMPRS